MTIPTINYNPNIPRPKDSFNESQPQFLQNFQTLYAAFARNHVPLDAASNAGNHNVIELAQQDSQFQTNAGEISVYAKKIEGQTDQIFLRYQGNQPEFRFTNYQLSSSSIPFVQTTFLSFLPGNFLIYFGEVNGTGTIDLKPYVAKNIVSVNLCAINTPVSSLSIKLVKIGDFFTAINFIKNIQISFFVVVNL